MLVLKAVDKSVAKRILLDELLGDDLAVEGDFSALQP